MKKNEYPIVIRRSLIWVLTLSSLVFPLIASNALARGHLVADGGFEKADSMGMPIGWQIQKIGGAIISLDEDAYSGERCITIETHETNDGRKPYLSSETGRIIKTIPIGSNSFYLLSFWYKFDHESGDELRYYIFGKPIYLNSTTKWTRAFKLFESGYDHNLDLVIELFQRTSKVWIDEVTLIKLGPRTNYLFNFDFEKVRKDGTPTWWTIKRVGSPTVKIENTGLYGRCISLEGRPTQRPPKNYPTSEIAEVSQAVPLKRNTSYDLSFWYQTKNLSDVFKLELLGKQHFLPHRETWGRKLITINSGDKDMTEIKFILYQRTGKAWVDHVEFSESPR